VPLELVGLGLGEAAVLAASSSCAEDAVVLLGEGELEIGLVDDVFSLKMSRPGTSG
jgi:hypothetical protein